MVLSALFGLFRGAPPPRNPVGPHPHGLSALALLAPVISSNGVLGLAIGSASLPSEMLNPAPPLIPQNADPSGKGLLTSGAERSEALTGVGVGPHATK